MGCPVTTQTESARKKFGEVLRFHREQRDYPIRRVADMLGCSPETVQNYEAGHVVPEGKAWDKYKGIVNRRLVAYAELRTRAITEAAAERQFLIQTMEHRPMATNGSNGHSKPLTHQPLANIKAPDARTVHPGAEVGYHNEPPHRTLHAKPEALAARGIAPKPSDTPAVKHKPRASVPLGTHTPEACKQREEWARLQFRQRPRMSIQGQDGLNIIMRQRFGVGISWEVASRIKQEVNDELAKLPPAVPAGVTSTAPTLAPGVDLGPPPIVIKAAVAPSDRDIGAAVQLVLDAIPNLRTFTITVDDAGEASIEYKIREVKIVETGGSMKVRR